MTCYGIDPTVQTSATEQWPEGPHLQTEDTMLPSAMCDGRKFAPSHHFLSAAGRTIRTVAARSPCHVRCAQMSIYRPQWGRSCIYGVSLFVALLDGCETS